MLAATLAAAVVLAGLVLVGASVVSPSGAESPTEAVEQMLAALDDGDLAALSATLVPAERGPVSDGWVSVLDALTSRGALDGVDVGRLPGIDVEIVDVELEEHPLADDLVAVELTAGEIELHLECDELPLGPDVEDDDCEDRVESVELGPADPDEMSFGLSGPTSRHIVAVRHDGGWYVSWLSSEAETDRHAMVAMMSGAGGEPADGPEPIGAAQPDEVLGTYASRLEEGDFDGAVAMLAPGETDATYRYGPRILGADMRVLVEEQGTELALDFDAGAVSVDGSVATVPIEGFEFAVGTADSASTYTFDGECMEADGDDLSTGSGTVCVDDAAEGASFFGIPLAIDPYTFMTPLIDIGSAGLAREVTLVRVEGRWYLSPLRTMFASLRTQAAEVDEPLDWLFATVRSLLGIPLGEDELLSSFESVGEAIDEDFDEDWDEIDRIYDALWECEEEFDDALYSESSTARELYAIAEDALACAEAALLGFDPEVVEDFGRDVSLADYSSCFFSYELVGEGAPEERWVEIDAVVVRCLEAEHGPGVVLPAG